MPVALTLLSILAISVLFPFVHKRSRFPLEQPSIFVPGKLKRESVSPDQAVGASAPEYASPLPPGKCKYRVIHRVSKWLELTSKTIVSLLPT